MVLSKFVLSIVLLGTLCSGHTTKSPNESPETKIVEAPTFTLQLLHFSDGEANILASTTAKYLAALVDKFEDQYTNSVTLNGGDLSLPGPFLAAGTDPSVIAALNSVTGSTLTSTSTIPIAAVDIAINNAIGVQASAIGNHEYDLGSNVFDAAISTGSANYKGASFPFISTNLVFSGDSALSDNYIETLGSAAKDVSTVPRKIVPSAVITTASGVKIGLVGATSQLLLALSSPSGTTVKGVAGADDMDLLASQLQPYINDLISQGIDKIVLLSHLQVLNNEKILATKLSGVDIILSAGSHTRLGDSNDVPVYFLAHPASFAETYPLVLTDKDGYTTLQVCTDGEYTYLGRLVVDFDSNGHVVPSMLNDVINGAYASTAENAAAAWGVAVSDLATTALAAGTRAAKVQTLVDAVAAVIDSKGTIIHGNTAVYLEGERVQVRSQETNLGSLIADSLIAVSKATIGNALHVSLKNAGGLRAQIGTISAPKTDGSVDKLPPVGGFISQLDVENSLRFNNKVMVFTTTPAGLKAMLENGLSLGLGQGRFPQVGGVLFSWDLTAASGSRVRDVALVGDNYHINLYDDGVLLSDFPSTIVVTTLSYMANGGDSYPMKAYGDNFRFLLLNSDASITLSAVQDESLDFYTGSQVPANGLDERVTLIKYLQANHATATSAFNLADTQQSGDSRIQNIQYRTENVLYVPTPEPTYEPTPEPTNEPTPEPTYEPTPEPTNEPTPEPTYEPTPEPTYEPTPEPTNEPTPEPTYEPTPEPTPEPVYPCEDNDLLLASIASENGFGWVKACSQINAFCKVRPYSRVLLEVCPETCLYDDDDVLVEVATEAGFPEISACSQVSQFCNAPYVGWMLRSVCAYTCSQTCGPSSSH